MHDCTDHLPGFIWERSGLDSITADTNTMPETYAEIVADEVRAKDYSVNITPYIDEPGRITWKAVADCGDGHHYWALPVYRGET